MRGVSIAIFIGIGLAATSPAVAQGGPTAAPVREAAFSVGPANLSHGDDRLGWGSTIGGAVTLPLFRRLALRVEGQRAFGPEPMERSCASVRAASCTGAGHYGVRNLAIWTASGIYYFTSEGVRPYVVGGLDVLHFTFLSDVTFGGTGQVRITEMAQTHTTMGIAVGAGIRVPIGTRLSVSPELTIYDGTILAGANLTQVRTSVAIGYRF